MFNALNCTSRVFGIKLLLIDFDWKYKLLCVWLCRRNMFHLFSWEHREQLDYVLVCRRIILKLTLKEQRLWLNGLKVTFKYIFKISAFLLAIFGRNDEYLAQLIQFWKTRLHIHCVLPPANVKLCNPHTTQPYRKSSDILSSSSKELERLTSHYTTKAILLPLHTHTHTHTHM